MARLLLFRRPGLLLILFSLMACAGCAGSAQSRFYQLSPEKNESALTGDASREQSIIVAIGPLRIPDYLDRPQIVTRSDSNELKLAEFDRWAGSLDRDIVRVLVENISSLLPAGSFFVTPWVSVVQAPASHVYRVEVSILRFEGTRGKSVQMKAQWAIYDRHKGLLIKKESNIKEEVHDTTYKAFVAAMSRSLFTLSRDITDAIKSLPASVSPS